MDSKINEPIEPQTPRTRFDVLQPVKVAIYLIVFLYASYVIVFGTTFLNEFQAIMVYGGILSVVAIGLFFWLGATLKKIKSI